MENPPKKPDPPKTLWAHFCTAWRRANARRPFSFYLLIAIFIVALLGVQVVRVRENPKQFALFLTLMFVFFFAVVFRAILDCFDIWRRHFAEYERTFRETVGEETFVKKLGERLAEKEKK
ncbi:MAG TPA: hypothetical protein HPP77_10315 [Candidatus Hydrogenedentes bacterium]|nr:hypothetical protein [Candidatus Hydrogenedentota bacterium]HIJ72892.1 hypothetical protein [Candidatus Hydrogenedentota bacterium]